MNAQLADVAWQFWEAGCSALELPEGDLTASQTALLSANVLAFADNCLMFVDDARLASAIATRISRTAITPEYAATICERLDDWRGANNNRDHNFPGRILASLHNVENVDAFSICSAAVQKGTRPFSVLPVLEEAIPTLESADPQAINHLFHNVYDAIKNDYAGGFILTALNKLLIRLPDVAEQLVALHEASPSEATTAVYCCALEALIAVGGEPFVERVAGLTDSPEIMVASPALQAITILDFTKQPENVIKIAFERCKAKALAGESLQRIATSGLCKLVFQKEGEVVPILEELGVRGGAPALHAITDFCWRQRSTIEEKPWFVNLVSHLAGVKIENRGTLDDLDYLLSDLIKVEKHEQMVLDLIEKWISNQPTDKFKEAGIEDVFDSAVREAHNKKLTSRLVTKYFLKDDQRYPLVASHLLTRLNLEGAREFSFAPSVLDGLGRPELLLLIRRTLGFFYSDTILLPLLFSLTEIKDSRCLVFGYLLSVFVDHVGRDFPMLTVEFIEARRAGLSKGSEAIGLCDRILASLRERMAVTDALPILKEFQCPTMKSVPFAKARARQSAGISEAAHERSILSQLATHIPLKAGRKTFNSLAGRFSPLSELHEMSYQVAVPLTEITDPLGAARSRLGFRNARKESE